MKRISLLLGILAITTTIFSGILVSPALADISVSVNGQYVSFDVPPQMVNDRVLVPIAPIFRALGAQVRWDAANQIVIATRGDDEIDLQIGNYYATVNGTDEAMDVAPMTIGGRTMVPVGFVSDQLGASVSWDNDTETVIINTGQ